MTPSKRHLPEPLRSIGLDLLSAFTLFILLFMITLVMGGVLVLFFLIGEGFALIGSVFFLLLVPVIVIFGLLINLRFLGQRRIKDQDAGKLFYKELVDYRCLEEKRVKSFILLKFASIGIIMVFFVFFSMLSAFMIFLSNFTCLALPLSYPLVLMSVMLPAVGWVFLAYGFDSYDPEPRSYVVMALLWGMFSTFPSLFLNTYNSTWMPGLGLETAVFSAPVFEELFKILGFILVFRIIRHETDGILYGATFGAGFALLENFLYSINVIVGAESNPAFGFTLLLFFRSFFNILLHMAGPIMVGFIIGRYRSKMLKQETSNRSIGPFLLFILLIVGYAFAVIVHASWNFLALSEGLVALLLLVLGIIVFLFFIGMVLIGFLIQTKRYREARRKFALDPDPALC